MSGEIDTLVLQMAEIIDAGGNNAVNDAAALAGDGKIASFTSVNALDKFGRAEMLSALKSDLKPLTDRLAAYANDGVKNLTNTFFRDFHQVLIAGKTHANWFDG